jgi:hypothetical protein
MNGNFSFLLLVLPLALCMVVWAVFGKVVGVIAFGLVLAMMAFNMAHRRSSKQPK